jgi:hypothetical protein
MGVLIRWIFGVSSDKVTFAALGIEAEEPIRLRLEQAGRSFLAGYHEALLEDGGADSLAARLDALDPLQRGFAYEGVGLGLLVRDLVAPWRPRRFEPFLAGPGARYVHLVHVGAGWALARLRMPLARLRQRLDPRYWWLALDGYGFYEGYFHPRARIERQLRPRRLRGYELQVFDTGLGRSLWFREAADAAQLIARIGRFPAERRPDLWSGVGLAAAYAGGVDAAALQRLRLASGPAQPWLAQGAAFGAKARQLAGAIPAWTELAAEVLCGASAGVAASVTDRVLEELPADDAGEEPRFEVWRRGIRERLTAAVAEPAGAEAPSPRRGRAL